MLISFSLALIRFNQRVISQFFHYCKEEVDYETVFAKHFFEDL